MFYIFQSRLVIQKPDFNKHYFHVVSATTDHSYPFSVPVASIDIIANSSNFDYISTIEFDDIVRLQVSIQYSPAEKVVWIDLFEGRVLSSKAQFGTKTTAQLICSGHIAETGYAIIDEAKVYASATNIGTIISYFADTYLDRTSVIYPSGNPAVSVAYSTKKDQKYVRDLFEDMEQLTSYGWFFKAKPVYDNNRNLGSVGIEFKPFATTVTPKYKAIQGTPRLISADFSSNGEKVYTKAIQFGKTPDGGTQYTGSYTDATTAALYGIRTKVNTDTGLESNDMCASFAQYLVPKFKNPRVSGTIVLEGTIMAQIGDLVHVDVPGIDLNGTPVLGNYTVLKVHHSIERSGFKTTLSVGEAIEMDAADYIIEFSKQNKRAIQNFVQ